MTPSQVILSKIIAGTLKLAFNGYLIAALREKIYNKTINYSL
jgi:hypothetical protein